jgi:hypothetical protein
MLKRHFWRFATMALTVLLAALVTTTVILGQEITGPQQAAPGPAAPVTTTAGSINHVNVVTEAQERPTAVLTRALDPQVPARVDCMPRTALRLQTRKIALRDCGEITLLPAVDRHHEMAGKAFDHAFRAEFPEALVRERRRQRIERRLSLCETSRMAAPKTKPVNSLALTTCFGQPRDRLSTGGEPIFSRSGHPM